MTRPTAIELFCGCGGLSTGLLDAGYDVRLGVDNDSSSIVAYRHNHAYRGSRSMVADVAALRGDELLEAAGLASVDMLAGGPPCQPFSVAGKRLGLDDPRAALLGEYVRLVSELRPRAILLENVPALLRAHGGAVTRDVESQLRDAGYGIRCGILSAADYGVPQNRRRLILVGLLDHPSFTFPPISTHSTHGDLLHKPHVTSRDALGDLPDVGSPAATLMPNHEPTVHTPKMLAAFSRLAPGTLDRASYHDRLHPDRPGYTLRAGSGNFSPLRPVHYAYDRVISVRESARLQSFSDTFVWPDSLSRLQQYRQVGNAVPPPLARAVGEHIADVLGWELDPAASMGDIEDRPQGMVLTANELHARREKYRRGGASFGKVSTGRRAF